MKPRCLRLLMAGLAAASLLVPAVLAGDATDSGRQRVLHYLASLARAGGGYGWAGAPFGTLEPTYFVIGTHRTLDRPVPGAERLADWVLSNHPEWLRNFEQEHRHHDHQYLQSLVWLGRSLEGLPVKARERVAPYAYPPRYERNGHPVLESEAAVLQARALLGLVPASDAFVTYFEHRRRANGSFNHTPTADGTDGNILNTWAAVSALDQAGRPVVATGPLVDWVRACQLPNGGFTHQPGATIGGVDDVAYTWAALKLLQRLGGAAAHPTEAKRRLLALANADGGFGNRPGWRSNPAATFRAVEALAALNALDSLNTLALPEPSPVASLPEGLRVFSIQIQAHGKGSPADAVTLAQGLKIDLWGAKNAAAGWIEAAQREADRRGVPVQFFAANEDYGAWIATPGLGVYSHMADYMLPPGDKGGMLLPPGATRTWAAFRDHEVRELERRGGRLIWQFGENQPLYRAVLDDSLDRPGYAAISTYHFGNPDFAWSQPLLHRWAGQLPFIALQDAHGDEPWWFGDMTEGMRTLFLAREATWAGWLEALDRNWVVAVRRDARTNGQTWMHAGSPVVQAFVMAHATEWQWWNNPAIVRPSVAWTLLDASSRFEAGAPATGRLLRVRCAWRNGRHGQLLERRVELLGVAIDGVGRMPERHEAPHRSGDALADEYYLVDVSAISPGRHKLELRLRDVASGDRLSQMVDWDVPVGVERAP